MGNTRLRTTKWQRDEASPFREMAKLAALTLMRQGEIRRLRREDVHLEQGVILLPRAKAGAAP